MRWRFRYTDRHDRGERTGHVEAAGMAQATRAIAAVFVTVIDWDRGIWDLAPDPERPDPDAVEEPVGGPRQQPPMRERVLRALRQAGKPMLAEDLTALSASARGSLMAVLYELRHADLVAAEWAPRELWGRARKKLYTLTPAGEREAARL
jgi:hypothetical protein